MAPYFRDPNLDDDKDQTNVQVSSSGEQAGPDGSTSDDQPGQTAKPTGSHFTNIDTYLQGGNAKGFGQEFGGKIQSGLDQAKSGFDTTANRVKSQIDSSGYAPTESDINGIVSSAGDNTSQADIDKFNGWENQQYKGPTAIGSNQSDWNEYWGKANQASTEAKEAGTESGRFALLDQYYGRPNYSFGQKSLDNLLIQNGGGFNNASDLQNQASGLNAYGAQQAQDVQNQASKRKADIEDSRSRTRAAIGLGEDNSIQGGALGGFQTDLDARLANAKQTQKSNNDDLYSALGKNDLTQDQIDQTGLKAGQSIYNLNLQDYINKNQELNAQNVASDQDYAKYLALSRLAGIDPTYLTANKRSLAGTAQTGASIDKSRLAADRDKSEADYNDAVKNKMIPVVGGYYYEANTLSGLKQEQKNEESAMSTPYYNSIRSQQWKDRDIAQLVAIKKAIADFEKSYGSDKKLYVKTGEPPKKTIQVRG